VLAWALEKNGLDWDKVFNCSSEGPHNTRVIDGAPSTTTMLAAS